MNLVRFVLFVVSWFTTAVASQVFLWSKSSLHGFHFVVLCITDRIGSVAVVFGLRQFIITHMLLATALANAELCITKKKCSHVVYFAKTHLLLCTNFFAIQYVPISFNYMPLNSFLCYGPYAAYSQANMLCLQL